MRELIKEILLSEGRLDSIKRKYSDIPGYDIEKLSAGDPSGNNAYLDWMVKSYSANPLYKIALANGENPLPIIKRVIRMTKQFHNYRSRINPEEDAKILNDKFGWRIDSDAFKKWRKNPRDINAYDFGDGSMNITMLENYLDYLVKKVTKSQYRKGAKEETKLLYSDDDYLLLRPLSHKSSCIYGATTKWCTTESDPQKFKDHIEGGVLTYLIIKNPEISNIIGGEKFAFYTQFEDDRLLIHDELDNIISDKLMTNKLDRINKLKGYSTVKFKHAMEFNDVLLNR